MSAIVVPNSALKKANDELKQRLLSFTSESGKFATAIEGLMVTRFNQPHDEDSCFYEPSIGLLVQGDKESLIGETRLQYGAYRCLVNAVDVPSVSEVFNVSPESPFLAVSLMINHELATDLSTTMATPIVGNDDYLEVSIAQVTIDLIDAFTRLMQLLDTPDYMPVLAPMLIEEIHYHILSGSQAGALRKVVTKGSHSHQIAEAISWLRKNYAEPASIEALAQQVKMTLTSFHRHFKKSDLYITFAIPKKFTSL